MRTNSNTRSKRSRLRFARHWLLPVVALVLFLILLSGGCGNSGPSTIGTANGGVPPQDVKQLQNPTPVPTPTPSPSPSPPFVSTPIWIAIGPNPTFDVVLQQQVVSSRGWSILFPTGQPSTILAGTGGGGIFSTTNGGQTWTPLTDTLRAKAISCMALDPNGEGQIIYAGTGEPGANASLDATYGYGVLKSNDGGNTWAQLSDANNVFTGNAVSRLAIRPDNSKLFVGVYPCIFNNSFVLSSTHGGLYTSTDGGSTFNPVSGNGVFVGAPISDVAIQPGTPNTMLVAVDNSSLNNSFLGSVVNTSNLPTTNSGIWRSTDGGNTWMQSTTGLPTGPNTGLTRLAFSPVNPQIVYALMADPDFSDSALSPCGVPSPGEFVLGLFVSTDAGQTWNFVSTGATDFRNLIQNQNSTGGPAEPQAAYDLYVTADPKIATTCYVQAQQTARIDNITVTSPPNATGTPTLLGATNTAQNVGQDTIHPHTDQHFLTFDSNNSLYTYCDGGIWRLDNPSTATQATPWVDLNGNLQDLEFYSATVSPTNPTLVAGGTQDNGTMLSMNPNNVVSSVWTEIFGGDGGPALFDAVNGQVLYVSADGGNLAQVAPNSSLLGVLATGINACDPVSFLFPISVTPTNPNFVLAATDQFYECTSALSNFAFTSASGPPNKVQQGVFITSVSYAPSNPGVVYGVLNIGLIGVRKTAGGPFVLAQGSGLPTTNFNPTSLEVDPHDPTHAFITNGNYVSNLAGAPASSGLVFVTSDSGATWTDITGGLPNYPVLTLAVDPNYPNTLYVGNEVGVFVSTNGGGSWSPYGVGLPTVRVWSLAINPQGALAAGTHGRSMWETSTSSALTINTPSSAARSASTPRAITKSSASNRQPPIPHQHFRRIPQSD